MLIYAQASHANLGWQRDQLVQRGAGADHHGLAFMRDQPPCHKPSLQIGWRIVTPGLPLHLGDVGVMDEEVDRPLDQGVQARAIRGLVETVQSPVGDEPATVTEARPVHRTIAGDPGCRRHLRLRSKLAVVGGKERHAL